MSLVISEPTLTRGQVPLLKHAVMAWLQEHRESGSGTIHGDTEAIAGATKAAVPNVIRAVYDLQKQGLVTFRERKNAGSAGHHSTVLDHFELTPKGRDWTSERAVMSDMANREMLTYEDVNPAFIDTIVAEDVAGDITTEAREDARKRITEALSQMTPAKALERVLRARGKPMRIRDLNPLLGYHVVSTAVYSIVRNNPEAFLIQKAHVRLIAPEGWEPKNAAQGGRTRIAPDGVFRTASRDYGPDGKVLHGSTVSSVSDGIAEHMTTPGPSSASGVIHEIHEHENHELRPALGPEITALMTREVKRAKVAEAVVLLEAAGLEDDSIQVQLRIPDDTTLEREVIDLVKAWGYR